MKIFFLYVIVLFLSFTGPANSQNLISFKKDSLTLKNGELERLIQIAQIVKNHTPKMYLTFYSNIDYSNNLSQYYLGFQRFMFIKGILDTLFQPSDSILIIYNPEPNNKDTYDSGLFLIPGNMSQTKNCINIYNGGLFRKRIFKNKNDNLYIVDNLSNQLFILNNILNYINYSTQIEVLIFGNYPKILNDSLDLYYYKSFFYIYELLTVNNRENFKLNIGYTINYSKSNFNSELKRDHYFTLKILSPGIADKIKIIYKYKKPNRKVIIYENPFNIEFHKNNNIIW